MEDMGKQKKNLLFRDIPDIPHISRRKLFVGVLIVIVILVSWGIFTSDKKLVDDYYVNKGGQVYEKGDGFVFGDYVLSGVDAKSFVVLGGRYIKDKNAVFYFYHSTGSDSSVTRVDGADMFSFVAVGLVFGKDKNHVFFKNSIFADADLATFSVIDDDTGYMDYAKDKRHVFFQNRIISDRPNLIRLIRPKDNVGIFSSRGSDAEFYYYVTDGIRVFLNGNDIKGADPTTFEVPFDTIPDLARDAHSIYFKGTKVDGVDVNSFVVLLSERQQVRGYYVMDRNHVYFFGYDYKSNLCADKLCVLETADPKTFVLYDVPGGYDAKDASHYFYNGNVVTKEK